MTQCTVYRYTYQKVIAYPCRRVAPTHLWNSPCTFSPPRSVHGFRSCQPLAPDWPHPCAHLNPTPERSLAARARFLNLAWRQIPTSPRPPAQKRRLGQTKPPSTWLVSTDGRPVGMEPTAGPLNPHGTTRSYSPLPRRCAEVPRQQQPPRRAAATRHPLRDHSRKHPGGCPRCC